MKTGRRVVLIAYGVLILGLGALFFYLNIAPVLAVGDRPIWETIEVPTAEQIDAIAIDAGGQVWVSGGDFPAVGVKPQNVFLGIWDGSAWRQFTAEQVGLAPLARQFSFGPDGRVWIAVPEGAAVFDGSEWKAYRVSLGQEACNWSSIAAGPDGRVWLGSTICGLMRFEAGSWVDFVGEQAFGRDVRTLQIDSHGRLWVGSGKTQGIFIHDGADWKTYPIRSIPYLSGKTGDSRGVWFNEIFFDPNGGVWLASSHGLVSADLSDTLAGKQPQWRIDLPGEVILAAAADATGQVFIQSLNRAGIMVRTGNSWEEIKEYPQLFGPAKALSSYNSFAVYPDGRLWFGGHSFYGEVQRLMILDYPRLVSFSGPDAPWANPAGLGYRLPAAAMPVLVLLALTWLWAAFTRPVSAPVGGSGPAVIPTHALRWILASGLGWLTVAGSAYLAILRFSEINLIKEWLPHFVVWMPLLALILAAVWAGSQWLAAAGRPAAALAADEWAAAAFWGALAGFSTFFVLGTIFLAIVIWLMDLLQEGFILVGFLIPPVLLMIYLVPLWIAGRIGGSRQAGQLVGMGVPVQDWRKFNTRTMVLSGLLGPFGGFTYGLATHRRLIKMIAQREGTQAGASPPGMQMSDVSAPEAMASDVPVLNDAAVETPPPDHSASEAPASDDKTPSAGSLADRPAA